MTTVSINLALLERAAERANKVQDKLDDYADEIPGIVNTPLASLEGGSSGYTSTAASRASAKARSLDSRASDYAALSQHIDSFVGAVRQADANVEKRIVAITSPYVDAMSFWQRVSYYFDAAFNDVLGSTLVGKFMNALHNAYEVAVDMREEVLRSVRDYFKYGDGKYVLNIALSALGAIGAVFGALASFPVSGVFAAIMAGISAIAAIVAVVDFGSTLLSNLKALKLNATEPGLARYYGDVDSVSDYANKTSTNSKWRSIASGFDTAGKVAGIAGFFGSAFITKGITSTGKTFKTGTLDYDKVMGNIAGKFGMVWDSASQTCTYTAESVFGVKDWGTLDCFERASDAASWADRTLSAVQTTVDGVDSTDDVVDCAADICGGMSGYDKVYDWTTSLYTWGKNAA